LFQLHTDAWVLTLTEAGSKKRASVHILEGETGLSEINPVSVHGRYGKACPVYSTQVQRTRYVGRETNYCPRCQTNGKLLADRSLSRLLKFEWPRTIEELEKKC